jgi:hypothetical protein
MADPALIAAVPIVVQSVTVRESKREPGGEPNALRCNATRLGFQAIESEPTP